MSAHTRVLSSARRLGRAVLPAVTLAALAVTCDTPTAVRRTVSVAMTPQFRAAAFTSFAGLAVDSVRATVTRPPDQVLATQTVAFSPDSTSLATSLTVSISGAQEQLVLRLDFLAGPVLMFTGQDTVSVIGGITTEAAPIPMTFVGPGMSIASLHVTPRDSGVLFGSQAQFGVTALDSSSQPVSQFYVSWSTTSTTDTVNAAGTLRAGSTRGWTWVRAATPTGIRDSARVMVQPAPSAVQVVSGGGQSAIAHTALAQPLVARVVAADNQPVVGVQVTFGAPAGGSVSPASGVTDTLGEVSTTATLGSAIGSQTFTASSGSATAASFSVTATAGVATKLVFTTQPAATAAGAAITPAVAVTAEDSAGNVATTFTGTVTVALGANPGAATLGGTLSASAVAGVASFGTLVLDKAAAGYTMVATSGALPPDTSVPFTITAGTAATLALVSGNNQNGAPNTQLAAPIVVKVTDQFGNPVPGHAVSFAVAAGGGSAGAASVNTDATGQASTTWTLGASGTQTLTVTSIGLAGSPISVSATVTGVASTTVTPHLDTLTSLGDTVRLAAQAKDFAGGPVSGTFTWSSADSTIAVVNATGLVTAVKNGSVLITAKEAGGTQDTARILVQQKVASVTVTPGNRSIYLTRTYQFGASAVDGRGHPVTGFGSFTWTTTAPAVATVDTTGFVTGVGLGNAQIKATASGVTGVANVAILTPITRIVVTTIGGPDSNDSFTMPSLGMVRGYQAIAHDTLDAVMTGVTFTWASSNPSVASLDSSTATTGHVTSQANGFTAIRATAQGVTSTPGASLTVSQVLASIVLSLPASGDTVGVGGTISLTARGKDANGFFMPSGTFHFVSSDTTVAKVDSLTGTVSGIAVGTATITASSGAINASVGVVVSTGGPAIISFGRDTLSVGRGSSTSIPILLSKPYASPLIVRLANPPAFAHWQAAGGGPAGVTAVTIPAGQTSTNATLVGDSAGTTSVTATDSSGAGYTAASATLKVTANMRLTAGSYAFNATDVATTQVLLSDPSPAGGTYITFSYSTPGIASVSPDPAFIKAGQLAADIQIRGLAAGTTTITPVATGVNGQASTITVYAPVLTMSSTSIRLGAGQYEPNVYISTPTTTNLAVPVTLASSDTTVAAVPSQATIPGGSYYVYFTTQALTPGTAVVTPSASGWTSANTMTVFATTPRVTVCCGTTLNTTSPITSVTVYSADSVRTGHYRINSLVVRLRSSDTTVMRVIDTVVTIQPGAYYTTARVQPAGLGGTAYVVASAPGHTPDDSTLYTVVGPKLSFSWNTLVLGAGQYEPNTYISTPDNATAPLAITVTNSNPSIATLPAVDTIPTGTYYRYFTTVAGTPGIDTVIASAPGYTPDTAFIQIQQPRITACCSTTVNDFGPGGSITVYSTDSVRNAHNRIAPLSVTITNLTPSVISIDSSTVTIDSGTYYDNRARYTPLDTGTAIIVFSAPGHLSTDTLTIRVNVPKLSVSFYTALIGRRQMMDPNGNGFYVSTPDNRTSPLPITLTHSSPATDSLARLLDTIPSGTYYRYNNAFGLANGLDTIIVTAAGYLPDTAYLTVSSPKLTNCCMPGSATTTNPPFGMTVYATDSVGNGHYSMDTIVVHAVSSDTTVIKPAQPYFRIVPNTYYSSTTVSVVGPGSASITYSDSAGVYGQTTSGTIVVTGPSLSLANGAAMLGLRQTDNGGSYVSVPNNVTSPLVVHLHSTDSTVATVPDSVIIPTNSYYAYFAVTTHDTIGTIQIQATALGYNAAAMNVQATLPKFVVSTNTSTRTTGGRQGITVYAADANGTAHYVADTVVVTLQSSAQSVASIDSTSVTIRPGSYYNNTAGWYPGVIGTAQLTATDNRAVYYQYGQGAANVSVATPSLSFSWTNTTLGVGQYIDGVYVQTPDNQAQADSVPFSHSGTPAITTTAYQTNTPISYVTIPQGTYYSYFRIAGATIGTDTLIATLANPAHNPDSAYTAVGQGRVDPISGWPTSVKAGDSVLVTLYTRDQVQNARNVVGATTFSLSPNANIEFVSGGSVITSIVVPADAYYVQFYLKGVTAGTGSASITNADYATYSNTVTVTP